MARSRTTRIMTTERLQPLSAVDSPFSLAPALRHLILASVIAGGLACTAHAPANASREQKGGVVLATLRIGDSDIRIVRSGGSVLPVSNPAIVGWVRAAATAVSNYYGRFPVRHVTLTLSSGGADGIADGVAIEGRKVRLRLGSQTSEADLTDDWRLLHEMFHLGFPDLGDRYLWMNEGLSDYLEPVVRARNRALSPAQVWQGLVEGFPQGLASERGQGLDGTHAWGRIYWGGTLFWLLADVRIRTLSHNQQSVDDAVRAILDAGGDGSQRWTVERVLHTADTATGTSVLTELHEQVGLHGWTPDLEDLWRRLGVRYHEGRVTFDDAAPLADVRRAILGEPAHQASTDSTTRGADADHSSPVAGALHRSSKGYLLVLQPPLPLQEFFPLHPLSLLLQPPWPLQEF